MTPAPPYPEETSQPRAYVVASTPRTGSWLLCEGLSRTGVLGKPTEYGPRDVPETWRDFQGYRSHAQYFRDFPGLTSSANGIIAIKLVWQQLVGFAADAERYLGLRGCPEWILEKVIGPYEIVYVSRRDKLRQAISLIRACQTGVWSSVQEADAPPLPEPSTFDPSALTRALGLIQDHDRQWRASIARLDRAPLSLDYEDIVDDWPGSCQRVASLLRVRCSVKDLGEPSLARQADGLTEEWMQLAKRYLSIDSAS